MFKNTRSFRPQSVLFWHLKSTEGKIALMLHELWMSPQLILIYTPKQMTILFLSIICIFKFKHTIKCISYTGIRTRTFIVTEDSVYWLHHRTIINTVFPWKCFIPKTVLICMKPNIFLGATAFPIIAEGQCFNPFSIKRKTELLYQLIKYLI